MMKLIAERNNEVKLFYSRTMGPKPPARPPRPRPLKTDSSGVEISRDLKSIQSALGHLGYDARDTWLIAGMALHNYGEENGCPDEVRGVYDTWSQQSDKFDQADQDRTWESFQTVEQGDDSQKQITVGTIFHLAKQAGWRPEASASQPSENIVRLPEPGGSSISACAGRIGAFIQPTHTVFNKGNAVMERIIGPDGQTILNPVRPARAQSMFEEFCELKKTQKGLLVSATCSRELAAAILASKAFMSQLPILKVLSRTPVPVIRETGELEIVSGYDSATGILADGDPPVMCDLAEAFSLVTELLADFQFATAGDYSRAIAALITPAMVLGAILKGRAPIDFGEANDSQTGKGYRNKITALLYRDSVTAVTQRRAGVGGIEEAFDRALIDSRPFICLDNIRGKMDQPALESFMTEDSYTARAPYVQMCVDPSRYIIMMTSNQAELTRDLANRSACVRIIKQPDDYAYKKYPAGDVLDHLRANQPIYLGAVLSIIKEWVRRGMPELEHAGHDFRVWGRKLGWIVEHMLKLAPLMSDHDEIKQRMSNPHLTWLRSVALAVIEYGPHDDWIRASDIIDVISGRGHIELPGADDGDNIDSELIRQKVQRALGTRLGKCFAKNNELVIDGIKIERQQVNEPKTTGSGSWEVKYYRFSRLQHSGLNPVSDKKPPHDRYDRHTTATEPPQTATTAIGTNNLSVEKKDNNVDSMKEYVTRGGYGGQVGDSAGQHDVAVLKAMKPMGDLRMKELKRS